MHPPDPRHDPRLAELEAAERALSTRRRRLHDRIDFARGTGAADPASSADALARLVEEEQQVSSERKRLHTEIDRLRVLLGLPRFGEERREAGIERPPRPPTHDPD